MICVEQVIAARGLLGWNQTRLAEAAGVGISTIKRMEGGQGPLRGHADNVWKVERALENGGVEFIDENGGGPGVRLKKPLER